MFWRLLFQTVPPSTCKLLPDEPLPTTVAVVVLVMTWLLRIRLLPPSPSEPRLKPGMNARRFWLLKTSELLAS